MGASARFSLVEPPHWKAQTELRKQKRRQARVEWRVFGELSRGKEVQGNLLPLRVSDVLICARSHSSHVSRMDLVEYEQRSLQSSSSS